MINEDFLCATMLEDAKKAYIGMSNGQIATLDLTTKNLNVICKRSIISHSDSESIYDLVLCQDKIIAAVDTSSKVIFFAKGKKIHQLEAICPFLS